VQHAVLLDQPVEAFEDLALPVAGIAGLQLGQLLTLSGLQKLPEQPGVERVFGVEVAGQAKAEGAVAIWSGPSVAAGWPVPEPLPWCC